MVHELRKPCQVCSGVEGHIQTRNGQDCVFCTCGKYQYNAPKTETGREVRSVSTVHASIKPKQRARILLRSSGRCELCGKKFCNLHVGHLVSVLRGMANGLTDAELNDDENLVALCDECNLGIGDEVIPLRLALAMLKARIRTEA